MARQDVPALASVPSSPTDNANRQTKKINAKRTMVRTNGNYKIHLLFGLLSLLSFHWIGCCNAAYIVKVPAKDEECFSVSYPNSAATVWGNYEHLDDDRSSSPLSLVIIDDSTERTLFRSRRGDGEGNFKIDMRKDQRVSICVQNGIVTTGRRKTPQPKRHDGLERNVGLQFAVEARNEKIELANQNDKLVNAAEGLKREISNLQSHHEYMRTRESMHRTIVETTFTQLSFWALIESATVILVAAGQVLYFRRFLEKRRYI